MTDHKTIEALKRFKLMPSGGVYHLTPPTGKMDDVLFRKCKGIIHNLGGKYKTNKKVYEFPKDPTPMLEQVYQGKKIRKKSLNQYFPTPPHLAAMLADHTNVVKASDRVLEPSAGRGDMALIVQGIIKAYDLSGEHNADHFKMDCIEIDPVHREHLMGKSNSLNVLNATNYLEQFYPDQYLHVIMNPPFSGKPYYSCRDFSGDDWVKGGTNEEPIIEGAAIGRDYEHVRKAICDVAPYGSLISFMSVGWMTARGKGASSFRKWLDFKPEYADEILGKEGIGQAWWEFNRKGVKYSATVHKVKEGEFKESGMNGETVVIVIDKHGSYGNRNMSKDPVSRREYVDNWL